MRAWALALCLVLAVTMPRDVDACTVTAPVPGLPGPAAVRITASVLGYADVDRPAPTVRSATGIRLRLHSALSGRAEETAVLLRLGADCSTQSTRQDDLVRSFPVGATVGLELDLRPGVAVASPLVFGPIGRESLTVLPAELPRTADGELDFSRVDGRLHYHAAWFEFDRAVLALRAAAPSERPRRLLNLVPVLPAIGGRWLLNELLKENALSISDVDRVVQEFDRALAAHEKGRGLVPR